MNQRPRKIAIIFVIICVSICVLCFCLYLIIENERYHQINAPESISSSGYNPANDRQHEAGVRMFVWDDKLYFYPYGIGVKRQFYRELCTFDGNEVLSLGKMTMLYAERNGYVYYSGGKPEEGYEHITYADELMCLDLSNTTTQRLGIIDTFRWHKIFFGENGVCYIPNDWQQDEYYPVHNGVMYESEKLNERYPLGQYQYAIEDFDLVRYDAQGGREVLMEFAPLWEPCIIPCENGLIVYNEEAPNLLYYIPAETQKVIELFQFEGCGSESAVNVHGDYVYVSFIRYEKWGDISYLRYENDTVEGTYRISLTDYAAEKLSDEIYDGLYIFDDSGILACKDGCIYLLDFDGNKVATILE